MTVRFINLTGHDVNILVGEVCTDFAGILPKDGERFRIDEDLVPLRVDGSNIPCVAVVKKLNRDFPDVSKKTIFIVSKMVAEELARAGRKDVCYPDKIEKDQQGNIVGARRLAFPIYI